ncbi:MAG: hypothetical protein JWP61_830 [Friedmanniella sp.]|nr:hypothetical protein [Friedmanniella sp.]
MRLLFDRDGGEPRRLTDPDLVELYRHPVREDRPWVRSNFVSSLDGSVQGPDGRAGSINTPSDQAVFALHRALADAIVVGATTVRDEGYRAVNLAPWQSELRLAEGLAPFPTLVIISKTARLDPTIAATDPGAGGSVLVVTTSGKTPEELEPLRRAGIEVVDTHTPDVDLAAVLDDLAGRGLPRLLCEGGPRLHRDLLAADLVDEMSLTLAPVVLGGGGLRTTSGEAFAAALDFDLQFALLGDDGALFTNYRRHP